MTVQFPAALTKADLTKNKGLLGKIPVKDLGKSIADIEKQFTEGPFELTPDKLVGWNSNQPGPQLDPVSYYEKRAHYVLLLKKRATALTNSATAAKAKLETAAKGYTAKTDKKLVAYTQTLRKAMVDLVDAVNDFVGKADDDLDKHYKAALAGSQMYQFVAMNVADIVSARQKLQRAIAIADGSKTIAEVEKVLGGGSGPARTYSTKLGTWTQMITKYFPKTAKSIYSGNAASDFLNGTWISLAADSKSLSNALTERAAKAEVSPDKQMEAAISGMAKEYLTQIKRAEKLENALTEAWKVLQKAAS